MKVRVITTGGTIDKVYFDATSEYEIGEPTVPHVFREAGVGIGWELQPLMRKDRHAVIVQLRFLIAGAAVSGSRVAPA